MPTAIFVDAGFFLKRFARVYPNKDAGDPAVVAHTLHEMALDHLSPPAKRGGGPERRQLHRIFVYDCPPLQKKAHLPISAKSIDFGRSRTADFRTALHQELRSLRKLALRLGRLRDRKAWHLKPERLAALLARSLAFDALTDDDFEYDVIQKGTDMKIGLDIASVSYKKQVDQIVLVSGDADFVPAAKLARREGIDFVLDPMWSPIADDLHEHIDGLRSTSPKPIAQAAPPRVGTPARVGA